MPAEAILAEAPGRTTDVLPAGWLDRADAADLQRHALDLDRHELVNRVKLRDSLETGADEKTIGSYKAKITEAEGERAATRYMLQEEPGAVLRRGFAAGTGYDQVWVRYGTDGRIREYIIVEAKGPRARLGEAKGGQMTNEWVTRTAQEMAASPNDATRELGRSILQALDDGTPPVSGRLVEADGAGGYARRELPEADRSVFDRWTSNDDGIE